MRSIKTVVSFIFGAIHLELFCVLDTRCMGHISTSKAIQCLWRLSDCYCYCYCYS